jgi:RNA polymerase sigma factor (sigma-70 family)
MSAATLGSRAPLVDDRDDPGYREFYNRYSRPLLCYLQAGFADADVEGVAQETMCRALKHWSTVGQMKTPWPWLAVTARNLARNNIRDERGSYAAGLEVFDRSTSSPSDVVEQVDAADQLRRLAKAMGVLTPLQRQILTVLVQEGLTGAEVARRLGMKPGAARMHLCRMRTRLAARFADLGGQLVVLPLGALHFVARRTGRGPQQTSVGRGWIRATWPAVAVAGALAVTLAPTHSDPVPSVTGPAPAVLTHASAIRSVPVATERRVSPRRPAADQGSAAAPQSRAVLASTGAVDVAGRVRGQGAQVERHGRPETAGEVVERCLRHLTVSPSHVGCDG